MITHLWEQGFGSEKPNELMGYRIKLMGVDRDASFEEVFEGTDVNEVKLRAINFIIQHHKLRATPLEIPT